MLSIFDTEKRAPVVYSLLVSLPNSNADPNLANEQSKPPKASPYEEDPGLTSTDKSGGEKGGKTGIVGKTGKGGKGNKGGKGTGKGPGKGQGKGKGAGETGAGQGWRQER